MTMVTMEPISDQQIERANVPFRRKILVGLIVALAGGAAVFGALQSYLTSLRQLGLANPDLAIQKASNLLSLTSFTLGAGLVTGGLYTFGLARSIYATKRYPPAGMPVMRDTRVITGSEAQMRGLLTGVLSMLVILGGILIPALTLVLIRRL